LIGAPDGFSQMRVAATTRTGGDILAHMGDLFDWASHIVQGEQVLAPAAGRRLARMSHGS